MPGSQHQASDKSSKKLHHLCLTSSTASSTRRTTRSRALRVGTIEPERIYSGSRQLSHQTKAVSPALLQEERDLKVQLLRLHLLGIPKGALSSMPALHLLKPAIDFSQPQREASTASHSQTPQEAMVRSKTRRPLPDRSQPAKECWK